MHDAGRAEPVDGPRRRQRHAGVPVQEPGGAVLLHPRAQRGPPRVHGVARLVVDALGRRVGEQHVGGGQAAQELGRLVLGPLEAALPAVARRPGEPAEAHAVDVDAAQVDVLRAERRQGAGVVVVAVDAQPRDVEPGQPLDPRGLEVPQQHHEVGPAGRDELGDRAAGRRVRQREDPHGGEASAGAVASARGRRRAPSRAARAVGGRRARLGPPRGARRRAGGARHRGAAPARRAGNGGARARSGLRAPVGWAWSPRSSSARKARSS